jgi:1,4-dihydroxy-2-naphthoate octaprenyltransferase
MMTNFKERFITWWDVSRATYTLPVLLPVALTGVIVASRTEFDPLLFSLTFIGVGMLALGCYIINDYFDYKSGVDARKDQYLDWSGLSRVTYRRGNPIVAGRVKANSVLYASVVCFTLVLLIGIYLIVKVGLLVLVLGLTGFLIAYFYSAPPVDLSSRALGEIFPGIAYGPLAMTGTYYVLTKTFTWEIVLISIPIGIFVSLIRWVDAIPGYDAHKAVGETKLTVILGKKRAVAFIPLFLGLIYLAIVAGALAGVLPSTALLVLLSLPLAIKVVKVSRESGGEPNRFLKAIPLVLKCYVLSLALLMVSYIADILITTAKVG